MQDADALEKLQKKVQELEALLAEASGKLQSSGIEIEASEGLIKFMMQDMQRIYEDLLRSQSQLMQSDKLATIGLLTAGIVHEINNPLSAANLAFVLLESNLQKLAPAPKPETDKIMKDMNEYVTQGKICIETMARIVSDIRMFSRSDKGLINEENVNNIIDSVIGIVWNSIKNRIVIRKEFGDLPKIRCNAQQLSQVFLNLIVNASQAMGQSGTITIRTAVEGSCVVVRISDTGCGMTDEVKKRIFEPFFTTKGAEQGTGLGLSITFDIVKKHNGEISADSVLGKGTTFMVKLPAQ